MTAPKTAITNKKINHSLSVIFHHGRGGGRREVWRRSRFRGRAVTIPCPDGLETTGGKWLSSGVGSLSSGIGARDGTNLGARGRLAGEGFKLGDGEGGGGSVNSSAGSSHLPASRSDGRGTSSVVIDSMASPGRVVGVAESGSSSESSATMVGFSLSGVTVTRTPSGNDDGGPISTKHTPGGGGGRITLLRDLDDGIWIGAMIGGADD